MAAKKTTYKKKSPTKRTAKANNKTLKNRSFKKRLLIFSLKAASIGIAAFFIFCLFVYLGLFGALPSEKELSKIQNHSASEVYSIDEKLMGRYYIEHRLTIDNDEVSPYIKEALVATEDSRFFEHNGLDFISLGRVVVRSIIFGDRAQGGGSTISQQLAKNLYPRMHLGFLTLPVGKTKEIFTAARLEKIYSKDEILMLYLNTVPFGEDIYGIEVASQRFFGKKSLHLNPAEAATLVGMLAANTAYNPRLNPERSFDRRNIVLKRMKEHGSISENEYLKWSQSKIELNYKRIDHNTGIAPYFREKIRVQAQDILEDQYGDEYDIYSDGLKIYTTIDAQLQLYAEQAVAQQMTRLQDEFNRHWKGQTAWARHPQVYTNALRQSRRYQKMKDAGHSDEAIFKAMEKSVPMTIYTHAGEKKVNMSPVDSVKHYLMLLNTGFVAMNPRNGHVLTWVGGIDHKTFQYDHVTSRRPVGSTFKPIVYAAALQDGVSPCDFISNEQVVYEDYDDWSPANSNGQHDGFFSVKGGLANSVNTVSAKLITQIGINKVINMAEDMGIKEDIPNYPSIALGTAELSLLDMVSAYTTFPNYGRPVEPVMLLRIEDRDGNVLYENEGNIPGDEVYDDDVAYYMVEMMRGVVERGTAGSLRNIFHLKSELAGKTGTTQDNSDGWFIGYTPNIVAGVWVGNDQPSIRFRSTALGSGGHMALPIFARFMQRLEKDRSRYQYHKGSFYVVPARLQKQLMCDDFSEQDPDTNFFDSLFDSFSRPDSVKLKKQEERKAQREERKKTDHKSVLQKMKDLFKKK
ncbi:transglycosylase domain-containing protein [Carboxylicivirga sediminis]|uniref:Transglycosylase domain-containing protein n=1 Tax=Carboxylicivirga sediminis TaxID=2006564 RepID=A0A941F1J1_9BACT|nr:transglycosylase domain-containing protein [Carboxylicivirga sediminis]MBR8535046.1 transglycosylase domain-containing protein [Carboxylicivirga sediminis]